MYKEFFGLEDIPFTLTPDPRFIVFTPSYNEVLASLYYGLENAKGLDRINGRGRNGKNYGSALDFAAAGFFSSGGVCF